MPGKLVRERTFSKWLLVLHIITILLIEDNKTFGNKWSLGVKSYILQLT